MQRSHRALLQRRADSEKKITTGRKRLYNKVPLSLVLLSWSLILLNSLIIHGNGYKDEQASEDGKSYCHEEAVPVLDKVSPSEDLLSLSDITSDKNGQKNPVLIGEAVRQKEDILVGENNKASSSSSEKVSPSEDLLSLSDITSDQNGQKNPVLIGEAVRQKDDILVGENNKASSSSSEKEQADEEIIDSDIKIEKETPLKSDRLSRVAPGLDEFKSRAVTTKEDTISSQTRTIVHRLEPSGKEYNYASATKGAKVLEYNKEAKGASNILDKDKDKYLRNPCSAEEKYVVVELSEETLVDTIEIANFEHYSSNFKDFQLLSSLVYPTDKWVKLGNFTAQNAKHAQRFTLPEPKWARYLKVNLLSHYGSEFYCTLSVVEVFGVDAVEKMLEDLISVESRRLEPNEQHKEQIPVQEPSKPSNGDDPYHELLTEIDNESPYEGPRAKMDVAKKTVPDPILENRQVGRIPGDTVLKILLQKVQSLDMNFSVLERYLEELNSRYAHIFKDFDDDIENKDILLDNIKLQVKDLLKNKDIFAKDIGELMLWKALVSSQLEELARDNAKLRSDFKRVREHQVNTENKGLVVIFISFAIWCLAAAKLFIDLLLSIFRTRISVEFCEGDFAWLLLLLSSSLTSVILVL